jgi:hypothetical protein
LALFAAGMGAYFGFHFGKSAGRFEGRKLAEEIATIKGR